MTNFIKTTAVAAVMALSGAAASAESYFGLQSTVMDDNSITIDLVVAETDGMVVAYSYEAGMLGDELGSAPVNAGANADVVVNMGENVVGPRIAVLLFEGDNMDPMMATARRSLDVE